MLPQASAGLNFQYVSNDRAISTRRTTQPSIVASSARATLHRGPAMTSPTFTTLRTGFLRLLPLTAALASRPVRAPPREFDGRRALEYARQQVAFGPRIPGTAGHRDGDWLDSTLRLRADTVIVQAWEHTALDGKKLPLRNFLAIRPAATTRVMFFAHWDTRPRSDGPGSPPPI